MPGRFFACVLLVSMGIVAQDRYSGPPPPKKDLPYIVNAGNLVETETGVAEPHDEPNQTTYVIAGAHSPAKTAASVPSLVIDVSKLDVESLQLYRVESQDGHRQITIPKRGKGAQPVPMITTRLGGSLFSLRPGDNLPAGEYSLTPQGSNAVFCFAVF
jgi:hypothetical protein